MRVVFKDNIKSYLLIFVMSIFAGLSVVFFSDFSNNDLWAFSYWSSNTIGFWMFTTSLIVLLSEKRKTAIINATLYIFMMFLITGIYKSFRQYWNGYSPFNTLIDLTLNSMLEWILYSILPAGICGVLGAVLWLGRKDKFYSKVLRALPAVFILIETVVLFYDVFTNHIRLFSALTDLVWLLLYMVFLRKSLFKNSVCENKIIL